MRVGCTPFLNARPLVWGLAPEHRVLPVAPRLMASALRRGRVDVGLVPVVDLFRDPRLVLIPAAVIGSRGAVRSVRLLSRGPLGKVNTLYADSNSGTSVLLSRLLLKRLFGVKRLRVRRVIADGFRPARLKAEEALLQIGDIALNPPPPGVKVHDLGLLWRRLTRLPFVFAVWAAVKGRVPKDALSLLRRAAREGMRHASALARTYAPAGGPGPVVCLRYLRRNLSFRLGAAERKAIRLFGKLLRAEGWR